MYSTCLFCNRGLGANQVVEHFPVGRRLAFDPAKGRLWAVCTRCERWNLSPLEERWEAIEECERLFERTRLRVSTENVGLARLSEGLTLIRIGAPRRPEMAAWRYGDQFGRRRRSAFLKAGVGLGAAGAILAGGLAAGIGLSMFGGLSQLVLRTINGSPDAVVARLPGPDQRTREIRRKNLEKVRLLPADDGDWVLSIKRKKEILEFRGQDAVRTAGLLLPALNRYGGNPRQVESAVRILETAGDPAAAFRLASARAKKGYATLHKLDYPVRLALEMAAHEETERRALEGELAYLERAWREAEEVADISDNLFLPPSIDEWMERLRGARPS